jgi:Hint domain
MRARSLVLAMALIGVACANSSAPGASSSGEPLSIPELKLAVLDAVGGHLVYCDPDQYPIPRGDPLSNARERLPEIRAHPEIFDAILRFEHLSAGERLSPDELIAVSDAYKQMQAIGLEPEGGGYRFDVQVPGTASDAGILRLTGTVIRSGQVVIEHRGAGQRPMCPICLAAGTLISTPEGELRVQDLRAGMPIWTTDLRGRRIAGVVRRTGHMRANLGHEVVRVTLADGRTVVASPGHPTADGRTVGGLEPGDRYDGSMVDDVELLPYVGPTWDLLPSGPTGTYFADDVLLGSTLK